MSLLPREDLVKTVQWTDLVGELDKWGEAGRVVTLWWRDDDAVTAGYRLDRLVSIAGDIPISLAVIPAAAHPELGEWVAHSSGSDQTPRLAVLQHGWCHTNHAADNKKNEFPGERSRCAVRSELIEGQRRLTALFGTHMLPVLAPPWNRFAGCFLPLLAACGIGGISRIKPRRTPWPAPGIVEANVHTDLVDWRTSRGFIGDQAALSGIIGHLQARRLGEVDPEEPTGILTHHLVQDEAADTFLYRLIATTKEHPATRWLDGAEVFANALSDKR
jgi:hypothetical protein